MSLESTNSFLEWFGGGNTTAVISHQPYAPKVLENSRYRLLES